MRRTYRAFREAAPSRSRCSFTGAAAATSGSTSSSRSRRANLHRREPTVLEQISALSHQRLDRGLRAAGGGGVGLDLRLLLDAHDVEVALAGGASDRFAPH